MVSEEVEKKENYNVWSWKERVEDEYSVVPLYFFWVHLDFASDSYNNFHFSFLTNTILWLLSI
jgi:hypothetical protein